MQVRAAIIEPQEGLKRPEHYLVDTEWEDSNYRGAHYVGQSKEVELDKEVIDAITKEVRKLMIITEALRSVHPNNFDRIKHLERMLAQRIDNMVLFVQGCQITFREVHEGRYNFTR